MLLSEIFQVHKIDPKDATYISALGLRKKNDPPDENLPNVAPVSKAEFEILGSGVEAVVYTTKDDPGVIKLLRTFDVDVPEVNIPYVAYVLETIGRANGNPYFPRISKMKKIKGDAVDFAALRNYIWFNNVQKRTMDLDIFAIKMERLYPIKDLSAKAVESMIATSFDAERIDQRFGNTWRTDKGAGIDLMENLLNSMMHDYNFIYEFAYYPDLLKDVFNAVRKITAGEGAHDLHSENFMARRTPTGYQIVITDPVI